MKYTENLKLKKPEVTDAYNIEDFNKNSDIVDEMIKKLQDFLTVEDISDSFYVKSGESNAVVVQESIYKHGNVISGSLMLTNPGCANSVAEVLSISDKYKPKQGYVLCHTLASSDNDLLFGDGDSTLTSAFVMNGKMYVQSHTVSDDAFSFVFISFSYICQ